MLKEVDEKEKEEECRCLLGLIDLDVRMLGRNKIEEDWGEKLKPNDRLPP